MPTRKWGIEKLVNTTTAGGQQLPQVTALAGGGFVVVWEDDGGANAAIRAQRYDAAGNRVGGEIAIATATGNEENLPSVTALADGGFYATWTELTDPFYTVSGSVYDANGAFVRSQPAFFAFGSDTDSHVARLGAGAAVAWTDPSNDGDVDFRIFDAAGTAGDILTANISTTGNQSESTIAASPNQTTLAIVWFDEQDVTIQGRLFGATGSEVAPQFRVDAPASSLGLFEPAVAWLNNDQFAVVWVQENGFAFASDELKVRIFDGLGFDAQPTALTDNIQVNSTTFRSQESPVITALPNGGFVVAWEDDSGIGVDNDAAIRLQAFDGSGNKVGGEMVVNTTTTNTQIQPSVAALPDGRVVVSWTDNSQTGGDTSGNAIRMQIIDPRDGIVTGTSSSETLYGHDQVNDEISAGAGDDTLFGLRGDDVLYGGDGNDALNGGIGADMMYGGAGNDTYFVDNIDDVVGENPNEGTDTIRTTLPGYTLGANVENLAFIGAGNFAGTGNALNNAMTGGAGNDTLNGGGGNDVLNGGIGADTMVGGTGNDIYFVDISGDVVTEGLNGGGDTVRTTLPGYTLGPNVENVIFTGAGNFAGTGNALNNAITGGAGNDTLNGGGGNDALNGGGGDDILSAGLHTAMTGGIGADLFLFTTPGTVATPDVNTIADFAHASDRIGFHDAGFNLGVDEGLGTPALQAIAPALFSTHTDGTFAAAGNRFAYATSTGRLYYDADGSAAGNAAQLVATLTTHPTLTAGDLFFIA